MTATREMLQTHPHNAPSLEGGPLAEGIGGCPECAQPCTGCGDECGSHAEMHAHCRVCAEACRRCEQAGRALLDTLG